MSLKTLPNGRRVPTSKIFYVDAANLSPAEIARRINFVKSQIDGRKWEDVRPYNTPGSK